ncbi:MAG: hypothetical protein R3B96_22710 [Pirellulaceae bacterium]
MFGLSQLLLGLIQCLFGGGCFLRSLLQHLSRLLSRRGSVTILLLSVGQKLRDSFLPRATILSVDSGYRSYFMF